MTVIGVDHLGAKQPPSIFFPSLLSTYYRRTARSRHLGPIPLDLAQERHTPDPGNIVSPTFRASSLSVKMRTSTTI